MVHYTFTSDCRITFFFYFHKVIQCDLTGIILVHDLTNRKSQENLQKWLSEILNGEERPALSSGKYVSVSFDDFDSENFAGSTQVMLIITFKKIYMARQ